MPAGTVVVEGKTERPMALDRLRDPIDWATESNPGRLLSLSAFISIVANVIVSFRSNPEVKPIARIHQ